MTAKIKLNAASGGGSFSLQAPSSSANTRVMTLPDTADGTILTTTNPKAGNIIQVVQAFKTDAASTTSTSFTDISGLSVSITASSASNKFLINFNIMASCDNGIDAFLTLLKDSSRIGDGSSGTADNACALVRDTDDRIVDSYGLSFLQVAGDTNAHTFKVRFRTSNSSNPVVVNRRNHDTAFGFSSSITVMEVAV